MVPIKATSCRAAVPLLMTHLRLSAGRVSEAWSTSALGGEVMHSYLCPEAGRAAGIWGILTVEMQISGECRVCFVFFFGLQHPVHRSSMHLHCKWMPLLICHTHDKNNIRIT